MRLCIGPSQTARLSIGVSQVAATYTLTVNITGGGSVTLDPAGGVYAPSTSVDLTANADPGWIFDHWEDDLSGSTNPETITMDSDKTVTAVFILTGSASKHLMLGVHF